MACSHSHLILLIVLFVLVGSAFGTLQCYTGTSTSVGQYISNLTCGIITHNMSIVGTNLTTQVNYSLHSAGQPGAGQRSAGQLDVGQLDDAQFCMIFRHNDKDQTDYTCDTDNFCKLYMVTSATNRTITQVNMKGARGTLYCCKDDLCNSRSVGVTLPSTSNSIKCYYGNASKYDVQTCVGANWCIHSTLLQAVPGVYVVPYGCDIQHVCDTHPLDTNGCVQVNDTKAGISRLVCCCGTDECNNANLETTTARLSTIPHDNLSVMPAHVPSGGKDDLKHWMFIGGIVAGVMFGTLMLIVVAILLKRYKEHRDTLLTYSYTQLTADLADDRETDDERMLVA